MPQPRTQHVESAQFNVNVPVKLRQQVKLQAQLRNMTVSEWVIPALVTKLVEETKACKDKPVGVEKKFRQDVLNSATKLVSVAGMLKPRSSRQKKQSA